MNNSYTFIDLFAGIGGFHQALSQLGMKAVFASEIDKDARETYLTNYDLNPCIMNDDIRKIEPIDVPDHDILCAGFPCQPFSQAGKKKGFSDGDESERGNLFFYITDILQAKRPKAFILENVRHLVKHDNGNTFKRIQEELQNLNYEIFFKVLKASDYGRPQHRPRIFIVGFDKEQVSTLETFQFPRPVPLKTTLNEVWEGECERDIGFTLRVGGRGSGVHDRRNWDGYIVNGEEKRLSPKEGKRMMGFPDDFKLPNKITAAMKQLGNSVCVDVVYHVAEAMTFYLERNVNKDCNLEKTENFMNPNQTFNKGEWSELYTFFKILLEKDIYYGNSLKNKSNDFVTVIKLKHNSANFEYAIQNATVELQSLSGNLIKSISFSSLINQQNVSDILFEIKKGKGSSFSAPKTIALANELNVGSFKGVSASKADIQSCYIENGVQNPYFGMGIKSDIGTPPTLLNASKATNFIFEIVNFTGDMDAINAIDTRTKIKDRITEIQQNSNGLIFSRCERPIMESNLRLSDSNMPEILSKGLLEFAINRKSAFNQVFRLQNDIHHVKKFLVDYMLGMFNDTPWNGNFTSNGFFFTLKSGEVLIYNLNKIDEMKEYLFNYTKFETASSSKHTFGNIYKENGKYYFKLNLQIRMK